MKTRATAISYASLTDTDDTLFTAKRAESECPWSLDPAPQALAWQRGLPPLHRKLTLGGFRPFPRCLLGRKSRSLS